MYMNISAVVFMSRSAAMSMVIATGILLLYYILTDLSKRLPSIWRGLLRFGALLILEVWGVGERLCG